MTGAAGGAPPAGAGNAVAPPERAPRTVAEAARQFEALLIGELLKSARGGEDGWLGSGEDPGDATAAGRSEEQFAQARAQSGGLGLGARIAGSLAAAAPAHKDQKLQLRAS